MNLPTVTLVLQVVLHNTVFEKPLENCKYVSTLMPLRSPAVKDPDLCLHNLALSKLVINQRTLLCM